MLSITDLKDLETDVPVNKMLICTVVNKGTVIKYGNDKVLLNLHVADEREFTKCTIYDPSKFGVMEVNKTYIISNFINKSSSFIINKPTNVFATTTKTVPHEVVQRYQESTAVREKSILDSSLSPKKTTIQKVTGIVTKVRPPQVKRVRSTGEEISLKRMKIEDDSGRIDVCLWRDLALQEFSRGDLIALSNFSVTDVLEQGKSCPALTNKDSSSTIERLPPDASYTELLGEEESADEQDPVGTILGVAALKVYKSCLNPACFRKQLHDGKCPNCKVSYSDTSAGKSAITNLVIQMDDEIKQFVVFTQQLEALKDQLKLDSDICATAAFQEQLQTKLPIKVQLRYSTNKISMLKVIQ